MGSPTKVVLVEGTSRSKSLAMQLRDMNQVQKLTMMMMTGTQSGEEGKPAADMELQDGIYLLSVFVSPPGATLSIEVERKTDGARWRGDYTARYIMDITQRAGNVKSFSNFVKMLRCATNSSSSSNKSLFVDVLTYQDLEVLKKDRRSNGSRDKEHSPRSSLSHFATTSDKRYLILTYITEFDRVHYPLPLLHEEGGKFSEEATMTRSYKQRLKTELEPTKAYSNRDSNRYTLPQSTHSHQRCSTSPSARSSFASYDGQDETLNSSESERCYYNRDSTRPFETIRMRNQPQILEGAKALHEKVRALEEKLRIEGIAHKKSMNALMRKNTLLEDEARKARIAERRMSEKLHDSEFQISLLRGRLRSLNDSNNGRGIKSNNVSPLRTKPLKRTSASPSSLNQYVQRGQLRPSSTPPIITQSKCTDPGRLRRPYSASPTSGRHVPPGRPLSLPSRSCGSSPMHSTTPPRSKTLEGRFSPRSTSSSMNVLGQGVKIEEWLQQASRPKRCTTPPSTMTRTTTPKWVCNGSHEHIKCRSNNHNRVEMDKAASEVGDIDSRLVALQDYLKRRNA